MARVDGEYTATFIPSDFPSVEDRKNFVPLANVLTDKHLSTTTGGATVKLVHNAAEKSITISGTVSNTTVPKCSISPEDCGTIIGMTTFGINVYKFNNTSTGTTVSGVATVKEFEKVPAPLGILGVSGVFGSIRNSVNCHKI